MVDSTNNSSLRQYLTDALKISAHPVRRNIIKELRKGGSLSASELSLLLEQNYELKIDRYNLYHHIEILSNSGLIVLDKKRSKGQINYYKTQFIKKGCNTLPRKPMKMFRCRTQTSSIGKLWPTNYQTSSRA